MDREIKKIILKIIIAQKNKSPYFKSSDDHTGYGVEGYDKACDDIYKMIQAL